MQDGASEGRLSSVKIATPPKEKLRSENGDLLSVSESQITEADSQFLSASSFGPRVFQPGTYLLDSEFLQKIGMPLAKIEAVSAIYGNSLNTLLESESKSAMITPGTTGEPPVLRVQSDQASARKIVRTMRKEIIAELGFVSGELLTNSLANCNLIESSLEAAEREVMIEWLGRTTPEGAMMADRIWESYTDDNGRLVKSTISTDYLEQRYGDAGVRLIEMAREE